MKDKILLNIISTQARLELIAAIAKIGVDFIEINQETDFGFKYELFKESIGVFICEVSKGNLEKEFETIKKIIQNDIKVIILVEEYSVEIINRALELGAHDIIVLPVNKTIFENKIQAIIDLNQIQISGEDRKLSIEEKVLIEYDTLKTEIARANRGNYHLSFVMFEAIDLKDDEMDSFVKDLREHFRETDVVYRYSRRKGLVICPFTANENIVDIEGKIKNVFDKEIFLLKKASDLEVYGLTYPKDGVEVEVILKKLEDGLHDMKITGKIKGKMNKFDHHSFREYHKMIRKKYE